MVDPALDGGAASRGDPGPREVLDRDAELQLLFAVVDRARRGSGGFVIVEGPAGIGKTALLEAVRADATDLAVGAAIGGSLEHDLSFGVVRQLFDRFVHEAPDPEALFAGGASPAARLFGRGSFEPRDNPGDTLHGLYWLTVTLAEARGPLLLVCDDAHWFDPPSLRFVAYLAARVSELPVAIVLGTRPPPPGPDGELLEWVLRQPWAEHVRPRPLGRHAVDALVRLALEGEPDQAFSDAVVRATGGNPFLIGELLRAARTAGLRPDRDGAARLGAIDARETVVSRLGQLSGAATEVARSVAVLGTDAHVRHVATLSGLSIDEVGAVADALHRAEVLGAGRPLAFTHPLVEAAIYRDLLPGERSRRHRDAGRALVAEGAAPSQAARHLMLAEPAGEPEVVRVLVESAREALADGATDLAIAQLQRALAEPPSPALRLQLVQRLGAAESFMLDPAAIDHLGEAAAAAEDPRVKVTLTTGQAVSLAMAGRPAEAARVLREVAASVGDHPTVRLPLLAGFAFVATSGPDAAPVAAAEVEELVGLVDGMDESTPSVVLGVAAYVVAMRGEQPARVRELAEWALRAVRDDDPMLPIWFHLAIAALMVIDRDEDAVPYLDHGITAARRRGAPAQVGIALFLRALIAFRAGDLQDAQADAGGALELAVAYGLGHLVPAALAVLVDVRREFDDLDGADELLAQHGYATGDGESVFHLFLLHSRARLHGARQRFEACEADLERGRERSRAMRFTSPGFIPWTAEISLARFLAQRVPESRQMAGDALTEAHQHHSRRAELDANRIRAIVDGDRQLVRAVAAGYGQLRARVEQARTLFGYAMSPAVVGTRREVEFAAEALALAERCGAARIAVRARRVVEIVGGESGSRPLSGVGALTASERRVAGLVAAGRTNKEVAQELYVTVKTVETHLSHCFQKLSISSRGQLREVVGAT